MIWFVKAYFAAAGKSEGSQLSPTLFAHVRYLHTLRFEISQGRRHVVAHKEKLVLVILLRFMQGDFERRHGENQPAVAGINGGKLKHITKKSPVSFGILGVHNDMRSIDQG